MHRLYCPSPIARIGLVAVITMLGRTPAIGARGQAVDDAALPRPQATVKSCDRPGAAIMSFPDGSAWGGCAWEAEAECRKRR
jgi:hypothetical protein